MDKYEDIDLKFNRYEDIPLKFNRYEPGMFYFYGKSRKVEITAYSYIDNPGFPNSTIHWDESYFLKDYKKLFSNVVIRDLKAREIILVWDEDDVQDSKKCEVVFGWENTGLTMPYNLVFPNKVFY